MQNLISKYVDNILNRRLVIIEVLTCILAFSVSFPKGFSAYTLGVWFTMCILLSLGHWRENIKIALRDRSVWTLFSLLALFVIGLISLSYADNTKSVLQRLFNARFPLFCIPLAIILADVRVPMVRLLKCFAIGTAGFVVWSFIAATYTLSINSLLDIYKGGNGSALTLLFYDILNRAYSNTNVALALMSIAYLAITGNIDRKRYVFYGFIVVLLTGFLVVNTSRMVVFSLLLVGVLSLFLVLYHNRKQFWIGIGVFVCLCLALCLTENRLSTTLRQLWNNPKAETLMSETPRFTIWKAALDIDKHTYLWGYGDGAVIDALVRRYEEIGFSQGVSTRYMTHNQYLELYLELGLPGLFALLGAYFFLWRYVPPKYRSFSILSSTLLFLVMLTECLISRTAGAMTFAFFFGLVCTGRNKEPMFVIPGKVENWRHWLEGFFYLVAVTAVVVFFVFFNNRANATYLLGHYRKFMAKDQSHNPPVYQLDSRSKSMYFLDSHSTASFFMFFLARNYQNSTLLTVDCYASPDYNGNSAGIISEDQKGMPQKWAYYDMLKKGTWQTLSLNMSPGYNAVSISSVMENVVNLSSMKGYVLFSNPKWVEVK